MTADRVKTEKEVVSALIYILESSGETLTFELIKEKAGMLAAAFGYTGDIEELVRQAQTAVDTRMGEGVSLVDSEVPHDEYWVEKRTEPIKWIYSDAYSEYLKKQNWSDQLVQSLNRVTGRILGHLQDPLCKGGWDRRGLVIGHVQSGKTANYMGLIAKAADAGYRFIIVIAGIHNNLRKQTQERIDEGFIGRSSDPGNRVKIGVGLYDNDYPFPATLTNIHEDFNKKTAQKIGWKINDVKVPTILVIKKNVSTLKALYEWLHSLNASGSGRITDVPMLLIDDEADNASINTNKPELDPTRTNTEIRKILNLFAQSCYLGYTATPFANIFINPDAYDEKAREELFPRDFIYCLDAPTSYFGPDRVFMDEDNENTLQDIRDCEEYIPLTHKKNHPVTALPPSLYHALHQFIIARAIRNLRGHSLKHSSMMVNVSRFVDIQRSVRDLLDLYVEQLNNAVKLHYAMPEEYSGQDRHMQALKAVFDECYCDCEVTWSEVKEKLSEVVSGIRLFVVNSKSDEVLDYRGYEHDGCGLTAIAIGGLSLSRGLTIEGLCVSYMYRNTKMYDTLMQMGRWFGYRSGYDDLCRIHLSTDSIEWYSFIAGASEELRQQIVSMRQNRLSPREFGLYVVSHPEALLITAANKMRNSERMTITQNYSGRIVESYIVPSDSHINSDNEQLISRYWFNDSGVANLQKTDKGWILKDVATVDVERFLQDFQVHPDFKQKKSFAIQYLQEISTDYPQSDVLLISPRHKSEKEKKVSALNVQERASSKPVDGGWHISKNRPASRGDEKLGLTEEQSRQAENSVTVKGKSPSDVHYREARRKPLLMIHIFSFGNDERVPGFGISFPPGDYRKGIEVVVNPVWLKNMQDLMLAEADAEDDDE